MASQMTDDVTWPRKVKS